MRPGFDLLVLVLVTALLGGLAELIHAAWLRDVDRLLPAFAPFLHGGLVATVLAPLLAVLVRQLHVTRRELTRATQGEPKLAGQGTISCNLEPRP